MIELYLIRHAEAFDRANKYPDDSQRPLNELGIAQAKQLAKRLESAQIQFDQLFSSPYTRAAQTAEPLGAQLKKGKYIQYLDGLSNDGYPQLIAELKEWLEPSDHKIALVGHEPYLSELASFLLTGSPSKLSIEFKKAAMMKLSGILEANEMSLTMFVALEGLSK